MSDEMNIATIITLMIGLGSFIWSMMQYFLSKRQERKIRDFETFHKLIKELVQPDPGTDSIYLDRQAAIIFELRHFKRYYEFTLRTLIGLHASWSSNLKSKRLLDEIESTKQFITVKLGTKLL